MSPSPDQLVGRVAELDAIHHSLARLERKEAAALEFTGEPGIGKTRLLAELAQHADAAGHIVLTGSASELEHDLPFWVFIDALDDYVRGLEPRRLATLDDEARAELAQIFPSLGVEANGDSVADERYRTQRAVRDLLEGLAATKPLVAILDDLHWADSGSIELLGALLRRLPDAPVLIAVALRPRQVPARLVPALERAEQAGTVTRVEVKPLDADAARDLLGSDVDAATAAQLYGASGGNPFYLQQLARSPRRPGQEVLPSDEVAFAGVEVPSAVAAALTAELALLPAEVRRVLEGAAVAGDPFEPELTAAAAGVPEPEVFDALDELLVRDLVRNTQTPRRFRFRHPLVRRAVYEAAPGGWRLTAHERTAAALAERGASAGARAHHVERSARHGDSSAIALLCDAGAEARGRAPATAARLYDAALRLLPPSAASNERSELLAQLGGAHAAAGQLPEARDALAKSIELLPADAVPTRVTLTAVCAAVENLLGRHGDAHNRLVHALEALDEEPSPEAARLMTELSSDAVLRTEYAEAAMWGERALTMAHTLGNRALIAHATAMSALGAMVTGDIDRAGERRSAGTEMLDSMSDEQVSTEMLARTTDPLTSTSLFLEHLDDASRVAERALAIARSTGRGQVLPVLFWAGVVRTARGELARAVELFDLATEIARSTGHEEGSVWHLIGRSQAAAAGGDYEGALAAAEESMDVLAHSEPSFLRVWAALALAASLRATGGADRAAELLLDTGGGGLARFPAPWIADAYELLAHCRLDQGRLEEARDAAAGAQAAAERVQLSMSHAAADRAAASVALATGDGAAAADLALRAAEAATIVGMPLRAADACMLAGRALAAADRREEAIEQLELASSAFERHGATRRRDAAERELGKLGRRRHRRTRAGKHDGDGVEALTERELEVAWLVVDRKTNAQIAGELFLSEKTVESHLRHLFQKLGVSSRVEVARVVERAGRQGTAAR